MNNKAEHQPIRAFLAVRLPLDLAATLYKKARHRLVGAQQEMFRWVVPQQQHVTLKFLGNSSQEQLNQLVAYLEEQLAGLSSFDCMTGRFDFFPDASRPKVLALHMHSGQQLRKIAAICEEGAVRIGFKRERRNFTPHVTLARFSKRRQVTYSDFFNLPSFVMDVGEVVLMQSHTTEEGSVYKTLHAFPLKPSRYRA
ncbi:RNA 2',3'-cyclic phosphodiesterase [Endozoicomonas sp. Mp262]|uniref:RNA 2',3'-cyclic phosphodiesterase n=1 Tax=Endozoicomonas sp. Mp262 TaxID=2919499 RepID=UPI0021D9A7BB